MRIKTPSPGQPARALVRWVEEGKAPERLESELRDAQGKRVRTRPLFPYPLRAKFNGTGSPEDAANYSAVRD